jgi:hypothetical protein
VYEVKGAILPSPWQRRVVDFKLDVGWNPGGLGRREVGAGYFGIRVSVRKVSIRL